MAPSYPRCLFRRLRSLSSKTGENQKENIRKRTPGNESLPTDPSASNPSCRELSPVVASGPPQDFRTARNVLATSLRALSAASYNLPIGGMLGVVIDPLLLIMDQIDEMTCNTEEVSQLAGRIERLTPLVVDVEFPDRGAETAVALQRELQSIKNDIVNAQAQSKLARFFNSTDDASSLARHNANLTQLIAESTLATMQEVRSSVYSIERSLQSFTPERSNSSLESPKSVSIGSEPGRTELGDITMRTSVYGIEPLFEFPKSLYFGGVEGFIELGDITGGFGGSGGEARIGGEGGEGGGPGLDMPPDEIWKVGDISGGTGGTGGVGIDVGGKGGAGKGPVIRIARRHLN